MGRLARLEDLLLHSTIASRPNQLSNTALEYPALSKDQQEQDAPGEPLQVRFIDPIVANWAPRGTHPHERLNGKNAEKYATWRYCVDYTLKVDAPIYPTDRDRVDYALCQMKEPIFGHLHSYVTRNLKTSFQSFMKEVERCICLHLLKGKARRE